LARIARERGVLFHTDAVQAVGKVPIDVRTAGIDLLSLSAHKFHGPQGIGALYARAGVELAPLIHGGGQERGLRSATENVAGIVGLGRASEIAREEMTAEAVRLVGLRDRLLEGVLDRVPSAYLIGHRYKRLPGHLCIGFEGLEGEAIKLLLALDERGIAVSSGSACSAHHAGEPSHVLQAMGFDPIRARGSLRITLGRFNTEADVGRFLEALPEAIATLRPIVTHTLAPGERR
jgi:cysteine desulfurase